MGNSVGRPLRGDEEELQAGNLYANARAYGIEPEALQEALQAGNPFPRLSPSDEEALRDLPPEVNSAFLLAQGHYPSPKEPVSLPPPTLQPASLQLEHLQPATEASDVPAEAVQQDAQGTLETPAVESMAPDGQVLLEQQSAMPLALPPPNALEQGGSTSEANTEETLDASGNSDDGDGDASSQPPSTQDRSGANAGAYISSAQQGQVPTPGSAAAAAAALGLRSDDEDAANLLNLLSEAAVRDLEGRLDPAGEKRCSTCGAYKPKTQFSRSSTAEDGLQSRCKGCDKARHDAKRQRNMARAQELANSVTSKVCKRCKVEKQAGEFRTDFLKGDGLSSYCKACQFTVVHGRYKRKKARVIQITVQSKVCKKCCQEKPANDFATNPVTKDGLQPDCKSCHWSIAQQKMQEMQSDPNAVRLKIEELRNRMRTCKECGTEQAGTQFAINKGSYIGQSSVCRTCTNEKQRKKRALQRSQRQETAPAPQQPGAVPGAPLQPLQMVPPPPQQLYPGHQLQPNGQGYAPNPQQGHYAPPPQGHYGLPPPQSQPPHEFGGAQGYPMPPHSYAAAPQADLSHQQAQQAQQGYAVGQPQYYIPQQQAYQAQPPQYQHQHPVASQPPQQQPQPPSAPPTLPLQHFVPQMPIAPMQPPPDYVALHQQQQQEAAAAVSKAAAVASHQMAMPPPPAQPMLPPPQQLQLAPQQQQLPLQQLHLP